MNMPAVSSADRAVLEELRRQFRAQTATNRTLAESRTWINSSWQSAQYPQATTFHAHDIPRDDGSTLHAEIIRTPDSRADRILLHCHGGGYTVGSTLSHRPLGAQLAQACQATVVTFDFRLAPEHPYPAALEDAWFVYRWLLTQQPSSHLAISGDSAGGSLAFALLLKIRESALPMPAGAIGLSAWLDLACEGNTFICNKAADPAGNRGGLMMMAKVYAGEALKDPLVSPLYAESLAGLCPILLQAGTAETLLDDSRRFAARALQAGLDVTLQEWPEMMHVWHSFYQQLPQARAALQAIGAWLALRWTD